MFEARLFGGDANAEAISSAARRWCNSGRLKDDPHAVQFEYFQDRYWADGEPTHHFSQLRLPKKYLKPVIDAFSGRDASQAARVSAVFLVIYRFRNNLFHGEKWAYGITDQLDNFTQSNAALMTAMDRHVAHL